MQLPLKVKDLNPDPGCVDMQGFILLEGGDGRVVFP